MSVLAPAAAMGVAREADIEVAMLTFWKVHHGRRAVVTAISPFIEHSRRICNDIPARAWLDPYMVGFIATLITLIAKRRYRSLEGNALAWIQASAWADLTGLDPEMIGEEICLLSEAGNRLFELGCQNGVRFFQSLFPEQRRLSISNSDEFFDAFIHGVVARDIETETLGQSEAHSRDIDDLWSQYFEAYV